MKRIEALLARRILPVLLRGACDATVPRSGSEGEKVNCYTTTIRDGDEPNLVLLRFEGDEIKCLKYDGKNYSIDVSETVDSIKPSNLCVTHFYGLDEVRFQGIWGIAFARLTKWPYALIHVRRVWNKFAHPYSTEEHLRRRSDWHCYAKSSIGLPTTAHRWMPWT